MAFNFFGTFSEGQWESFKAFVKIQEYELQLRFKWLNKQLEMNGKITTIYDETTNRPLEFSAPPNSYLGKLLTAYKILGGVPENDMLLRSFDKPVYLTRSNAIRYDNGVGVGGYSEIYSNGRRYRGGQRFDRDLGLKVEKIKSWTLESIKFKRENLEFKIKNAIDYSDQLQSEANKIKSILDDVLKSVDMQFIEVENQMNTPGTANITRNKEDVFGLEIGKPTDMSLPDALEVAKEQDERGV